MALIPGDRHVEGLLLPSALWHNRLLGQQRRSIFRRGPFVRREAAHEAATLVIDRFDVKAPDADTEVQALSGGNQQKFIVGRELMSDPKLLLAAQPTRGVDVGAQAMLWDHLRAARADGRAVVLVSSDLDELLQLSDRLVVMLRGRIVADLDPTKVTAAQLGEHMTGSESSS
jgi:simple sugar transport system ATP-binding protein